MKRALIKAIINLAEYIADIALIISIFCIACYMAGVFFSKGVLDTVKEDRAAAVIIGGRS